MIIVSKNTETVGSYPLRTPRFSKPDMSLLFSVQTAGSFSEKFQRTGYLVKYFILKFHFDEIVVIYNRLHFIH